jgi:hypothetical protein
MAMPVEKQQKMLPTKRSFNVTTYKRDKPGHETVRTSGRLLVGKLSIFHWTGGKLQTQSK